LTLGQFLSAMSEHCFYPMLVTFPALQLPLLRPVYRQASLPIISLLPPARLPPQLLQLRCGLLPLA